MLFVFSIASIDTPSPQPVQVKTARMRIIIPRTLRRKTRRTNPLLWKKDLMMTMNHSFCGTSTNAHNTALMRAPLRLLMVKELLLRRSTVPEGLPFRSVFSIHLAFLFLSDCYRFSNQMPNEFAEPLPRRSDSNARRFGILVSFFQSFLDCSHSFCRSGR
jgi:hypothetical protein